MPIVVTITLIGFAYAFVRYFLLPANALDATLADVARKVEAARSAGGRNLTLCFAGDDRLAAIWQEFRETLHAQKALDPTTGELVEVAVRSTVPAEMYLSPHAVIDGRVHAEFFTHLPGIFTGIGIIGTFFGLLKGPSFAICSAKLLI